MVFMCTWHQRTTLLIMIRIMVIIIIIIIIMIIIIIITINDKIVNQHKKLRSL